MQHKGGKGKNHKEANQNTIMKQMTTSSSSVQQPTTTAYDVGPPAGCAGSRRCWQHYKPHHQSSLSLHSPLHPFPPQSSFHSFLSFCRDSSYPLGRDRHAGGPQHQRGWFQVKTRATRFSDVPFTMEPEVHFTLEITAAFAYLMAHGRQEASSTNPHCELKSGKDPEFLRSSLLLLGLPIMVLPNQY